MDNQNKNLILATALSFLVMLVWFALFPPTPPQPLPTDPAQITQDTSASIPTATAPEGAEGATPAVDDAAEAVANAPRIAIETDRLTGSISLLGGRIDDLKLKDYRVSQDAQSDIVTLLAPVGSDNPYYALYGWAPAAGLDADLVPGASTEWSVDGDASLTQDSPITLTWDNGAGLVFTRQIEIDDDFMFSITQSVQNTGTDPVSLAPYGVIARHGEPQGLKNFFILHEGLVRMVDGELHEVNYDNIEDLSANDDGTEDSQTAKDVSSGWTGFTDHYWMTQLIPGNNSNYRMSARVNPRSEIYQTEIVTPAIAVAPGSETEVTTQFFAGAKEWEAIRNYQNEGGIDRFLDSIDWGWFYFLTKPIFAVLHYLNALIGNMGWAIIGLTLVIKAVLLPLAYKSYVSMAKMKELQPEMEKLKESAGEDREKLQKGMMELYKKNKVNPASGCLPILLQIPIFFSLYKVIFVTLELRHAPWIGWIQDLSAPDPSSILNLFGLLPYATPEPGSILFIFSLGVMPIILGISMWLQQKLNPAPTDPTQAMIFAWMPWVFMFMLGTFASGLVLYWIANNLITFSQQYLIMRSQGIKPDVFGNIKQSFKRTPKNEAE